MGLGGRLARRCRPHVVLAMAIALVVLGGGLTNWRRPDPEPSPTRRPAAGPLRSWVTPTVAGPSTLVDARGHRWLPDSGHLGGQSSVTSADIEGTSSQGIYQHERWGMRGYIIQGPAPATYAINLYLAETRVSTPRQRVFDVTAEGVVKASDVDIVGSAGRNHAYHVGFTAAVTDGQLDLGFVNKIDQAKVNGIEVAFLRRSTASR